MARKRSERGKAIRRFILLQVNYHPRDLVKVTGSKFRISRQAAGRYVSELVDEGALEATGAKRQRSYALRILQEYVVTLPLPGLEEHLVWRDHVKDALGDLPEKVREMWQYGFTEMVNNAIDHSGGQQLTLSLKQNALVTNVTVVDDGIGIFHKIKEVYGLEEERQAILELAKGKLTTDPEHHTGEGIFFTSRIMDDFAILSGDVVFMHGLGEKNDWILEVEGPAKGTGVFMGLDNDSDRTSKEVFDHFASDPDDYGFTKTVVPVRLVREGAEKLVSRSQAKRLLSRLERFRTVVLDFEGVDTIGRAFADEIFRVFVRAHPNTLIIPIKMNKDVERLVAAARNQNAEPSSD